MRAGLSQALRWFGAGVAAGVGVLGLVASASPSPAGASTYNSADIVWGLWGSGPYACTMYVGHEPAYGGALAWSWTPDPNWGGAGCWSSYAIIYSTQTAAISAGGNPSSAVVVGGWPTASQHLACYGLWDCDSSWYYLP